MPQLHLTIAVRDHNNTYHARAVKCINASTLHLVGRKATCTAGREQVIHRLLEYAPPKATLATINTINRGETHDESDLYHVVVDVEEAGLKSQDWTKGD